MEKDGARCTCGGDHETHEHHDHSDDDEKEEDENLEKSFKKLFCEFTRQNKLQNGY